MPMSALLSIISISVAALCLTIFTSSSFAKDVIADANLSQKFKLKHNARASQLDARALVSILTEKHSRRHCRRAKQLANRAALARERAKRVCLFAARYAYRPRAAVRS